MSCSVPIPSEGDQTCRNTGAMAVPLGPEDPGTHCGVGWECIWSRRRLIV